MAALFSASSSSKDGAGRAKKGHAAADVTEAVVEGIFKVSEAPFAVRTHRRAASLLACELDCFYGYMARCWIHVGWSYLSSIQSSKGVRQR